MAPVLALSHHSGARLAEVAYLLLLFAGIWMVAAQLPRFRLAGGRSIVAGLAIAAAGLLLIIAAHWGHYG